MMLAEPYVTYLGPVAIWWIPKHRSPRISLLTAVMAWMVALPLLFATVLWLHAESRPLWVFGRPVSSLVEILFRYELILLVYLAYTTLRSLPVWIQCYQQAKRDGLSIESAIREERWELAGLLIHRYCLLLTAIRRRVPARVSTWDGIVCRKLPQHRRLYVYFRNRPPEVPPDAKSGFTPAVIPPPYPAIWSAAGVIVVAMLIYLLVVDIIENGYWQRLVLFNAVLLLLILSGYGFYFFTSLLGRAYYYRFAPGVFQLVKFTVFRGRPLIEAFNLRSTDAILDLCSPWPAITLLNTPDYKRETFRLSKGAMVTEAIMRAALSTVSTPPLPEDGLID